MEEIQKGDRETPSDKQVIGVDDKEQVEVLSEYEGECEDLEAVSDEDDEEQSQEALPKNRKLRIQRTKKRNPEMSEEDQIDEQQTPQQQLPSFKLPNNKAALEHLLYEVKCKIKMYKYRFMEEVETMKGKESFIGNNSIPVCADIREFDFAKLAQKQKELTGRQFDVLMMDPPWRLSTSQPSRGVAIQYDSLSDQIISQIPVPALQESGFLFVWVINNKLAFTVDLMETKWGYRIIDQIPWVKKTVNGKIAKGHGFYLQHAKEICLVGVKGDPVCNKNVVSNVIFSERRGQSQKPTQIYEYIEELVPNGFYLQIFGRRNNLRNGWVTIGNEL